MGLPWVWKLQDHQYHCPFSVQLGTPDGSPARSECRMRAVHGSNACQRPMTGPSLAKDPSSRVYVSWVKCIYCTLRTTLRFNRLRPSPHTTSGQAWQLGKELPLLASAFTFVYTMDEFCVAYLELQTASPLKPLFLIAFFSQQVVFNNECSCHQLLGEIERIIIITGEHCVSRGGFRSLQRIMVESSNGNTPCSEIGFPKYVDIVFHQGSYRLSLKWIMWNSLKQHQTQWNVYPAICQSTVDLFPLRWGTSVPLKKL